jgi:FkbM family methyltransferase
MSPQKNNGMNQIQATVYDCGGRGGMNEKWLFFPLRLNYVSFDPESKALDELHAIQQSYNRSNPNIQFSVENYALAAKNGIQKLNVYSSPDLSSFLEIDPEITHRYRHNDIRLVEQVAVNCETLDNISQRRQEQPDFLSIDTQGTEIHVLKGAERILAESVIGLRCEVEFVSLYRQQPLFDQVWRFLADRDFQLIRFDKTGTGEPGISTDAGPFSLAIEDAKLAWADAIFFRKPDQIDAMPDEQAADWVLKYVLFALANDCGSIGLDLLWRLGEKKQLRPILESLSETDHALFVNSVEAYLEGVEIADWQTEPHYLKWYQKARGKLREQLW